MEDDLRVCRNRSCDRYQVIVQSNSKRCVLCQSKMRRWAGDGEDDQPVLIEGASGAYLLPDKAGNGHTNGPLVFASNCDVAGCPVAPKATVRIPFRLYQKWVFLAHKFNTEWAAFLRGEASEGWQWTISEEGMYFPKQICTGSHVDVGADQIEPNTIAAVHSHVNFPAFFSGEDKSHFNHPIELVVNRAGECQAMARIKLECGRWERVKAHVTLTGCDEDVGLADALRAKLTVKPEPAPPSPNQSGYRGNQPKYQTSEGGTVFFSQTGQEYRKVNGKWQQFDPQGHD